MKPDGNGGYYDAGIQAKANSDNFILNVNSYLGNPNATYSNNKITLHMRVLNDSQDIGISLTTEDLLAEPAGFIPNTGLYEKADAYVKSLNEDDYEIDIESKTITLTPSGVAKAEKFFKVIIPAGFPSASRKSPAGYSFPV